MYTAEKMAGITTYCEGPKLHVSRDVTKADFMAICDQMGCCPEAISEGGFHYINIPGYKSLRLHMGCAVRVCKRSNGVWALYSRGTDQVENPDHWPWINETKVSAEWRGNNDIIMHSGQRIETTLKAFDHAAPFTLEELQKWKNALESVRIELPKLPKPHS